MTRRLRLAADYDAYPVWDVELGEPLEPGDLPISEALESALAQWADTFSATLVLEDPATSGFASPAEGAAFALEGEDLARRLRAELGDDHEVSYRGAIESSPAD